MALIITPADAVTTSNVAEVVRLRFSPPHPEVSRLLLLAAPDGVVIKNAIDATSARVTADIRRGRPGIGVGR